MLIVCDNEELRYYSKRATIKRNGTRQRGRVQLREYRIELSNLLHSSKSESPETMNRIDFLQKKIKSLEKDINKFLPASFILEMKQMADDYSPENKGVIEIIKTPFQAEPEIARQMVCGDANCIISGDGDFQMYIGASASTNMMIWFSKIHYGSSSFKSAQIVTGQKGIMMWINNSLQLKGTDNYFPKDPPFPIFANCNKGT